MQESLVLLLGVGFNPLGLKTGFFKTYLSCLSDGFLEQEKGGKKESLKE